jgi:hypothetical protein
MVRRYVSILALALFSLALAGCGAVERWFTPTIRLDLSGVQSVTIEDSWVGLAPMYASTYTLSDEDGAWVGSVLFMYGNDESVTQEETISIPADAVQRFIDTLETAPAYEGDYEPLFTHTDDYPSITFTFQTSDGIVEVYSRSQGEFAVPWAATLDGKTYIIDSDIPARALEEIAPYLKYEEREAFLDDAR